MRAALYYGRQDLRLTSVPEPEPGPGELKLRVRYNGMCGSDLHEYYDGPITTRSTPHPLTGVQNPVIMGHELCGEVVALGEGIDDLIIGNLVAVEPVETCGRCLHCGIGQYNHCPSLAIQGYNRAGGLAEYTVVKRRMAHALPPGVTALQGALIEPLAIAWHTVNRCAVSAGQTVAIHGAGPIGAGAFLTLRRRGVEAIVVDPSPARRAARGASRPRRETVARSDRVRCGGGNPRSHQWPRCGCLDRRGGGAPGLCRDAARHPGRWDRGGGGDPPRAGRHTALRLPDAGSAPYRCGALRERLSGRHRGDGPRQLPARGLGRDHPVRRSDRAGD